jgi:hypothetical protein
MGPSDIIKSAVKPPFANYDIVVYFGCGLFVLPFLRHYVIEPFGLHFPVFNFGIGIAFVDGFITTLSLLFAVYILGHIIAYIGSQLIEKTAEMAFDGKTSALLLASSEADDETRSSMVKDRLRSGLSRAASKHSRFAALVRFGAHLPALPLYGPIYWLGLFGFYSTRVPSAILDEAKARLEKLSVGVNVSGDGTWFKTLEGVVINNHPIATARMYNYLIISGLFRSVALIFLSALWMEIMHFILRHCFGAQHIGHFLSDEGGAIRWLFGYAALLTIYIFALFSFLKFQRRYVEEAIFAFVLTKEDGL